MSSDEPAREEEGSLDKSGVLTVEQFVEGWIGDDEAGEGDSMCAGEAQMIGWEAARCHP